MRYKIQSSPLYMLEISQELAKATKEVEYMVSKLGNLKANKDLIDHCRNTSDIEHTVDELYRNAVGKLFETNDPVSIIKLKDIYEAIEAASDRCVDVAEGATAAFVDGVVCQVYTRSHQPGSRLPSRVLILLS